MRRLDSPDPSHAGGCGPDHRRPTLSPRHRLVTELFAGPWGPILIFGLRIVDVTLATMRMLLVMRNQRTIVPFIGFFEAAIWVLAIGTAIQNLHSVWHILGYAGGFASGTLVGLWLEGKLAMGLASVRIISRNAGEAVADALRHEGFGVTEFSGYGREGRVELLLTLVKRRQINRVIATVEAEDHDAFISVEEPRTIRRGWLFSTRRK
ncbi:MAG: DUF2179 domain-containing protein [Gemmatimonadales bacterium]|nr:MAG: DUF2179 domain-containing protein [Gemmatimonadales bacterium]